MARTCHGSSEATNLTMPIQQQTLAPEGWSIHARRYIYGVTPSGYFDKFTTLPTTFGFLGTMPLLTYQSAMRSICWAC